MIVKKDLKNKTVCDYNNAANFKFSNIFLL